MNKNHVKSCHEKSRFGSSDQITVHADECSCNKDNIAAYYSPQYAQSRKKKTFWANFVNLESSFFKINNKIVKTQTCIEL